MPSKNPEILKAIRKRHYDNNKEQVTEKIKKRQQEMRVWFQELKTKYSCSICGENHPACIDFHHLNAKDKEMDVSQAIKWGWSKQRIESEIAKCITLCSNCHRKLHYEKARNEGFEPPTLTVETSRSNPLS